MPLRREVDLDTVDLGRWLPYLTTQRMQRAWEFADPLAESPGESVSRAVFAEHGLAPPQLQRVITTELGTFRMDFCWEEDGVVGEFDGRMKYEDGRVLDGRDPRKVYGREKRREEAIRRRGWRVERWGAPELRRPQLLVSQLRRAGVSRG